MNKKILSFGFAVAMAGAMIVSCVKKENNTIKTNIVTKSTSTSPGTTSATTAGSTTGHTKVTVPCIKIPKDSIVVRKGDQSGFSPNPIAFTSAGGITANGHYQIQAADDNGNQVTVRFATADGSGLKFDSVFTASGSANCDNLLPNQVCVNFILNSGGTNSTFSLTQGAKVYMVIDKVTNKPDIYICGDPATDGVTGSEESFTGVYSSSNVKFYASVQLNVTQ
jgi:hypothetical protein